MTYGTEQVITLTNLARMGLFYEQGSIKEYYPFADIKKELRLISENPINHENPSDTSFAYGGYTPVMYAFSNVGLNWWKELSRGDGEI